MYSVYNYCKKHTKERRFVMWKAFTVLLPIFYTISNFLKLMYVDEMKYKIVSVEYVVHRTYSSFTGTL